MTFRFHIVLMIVLMSGIYCRGQDFPFIQFGQSEGLVHSQIMDISQDSNGNLWLGTATRSIYRFDGKSFFQYKISIDGNPSSILTLKVLPDSHHLIWILTNNGLVKFDGAVSKAVPQNGSLSPGMRARLFKDQSERLWVIDDKGEVFEMEGDTLNQRVDISKLAEGKITGYYYGKNGLIFFSANGNSVSVSEDRTIHREASPWEVNSPVQAVVRSSGSDIVATKGSVWQFFDGKKIMVSLPDSLKEFRVRQMERDRNGLVWMIVRNKLLVIDNDNQLHLVNNPQSTINNNAICILKDKDGNVWASVDIKGILKFKKQPWHKIADTTGKDITSIAESDDGRLIYGSYNDGMIGLQGNTFGTNAVTAIGKSDNGNILVATLKGGLYEISPKGSSRVRLSSLKEEDVLGADSKSGMLVAGASNGLYVIRNGETRFFPVTSNGKSVQVTNPVIADKTVFFAGMGEGVMKLADDSVTAVGPDFLRKSTIYNIRKLPWGDYLVTGEFSKILLFDKRFNLKRSIDVESFASNVLLAEFFNESTLLLGSNDGLFKVVLDNDRIKSMKKYGKEDGFGEEELYVGASLLRKNGDVVIGTVDGAYAFKASEEEMASVASTAYITKVDWIHKKDEDTDSLTGYFRIPIHPKLNHTQNSVTFSYGASNLSNPNNIKFHHQLQGAENEWSPVSTTQEVTYSNLSPGDYIFNIQAISEDKIYGNIQKYAFTIEPAVWQQWYFYIIVLAVLFIIIFLIIRLITSYRIEQHQLSEEIRATESVRLRKRMSMDFHDEMGNKLAGMMAQASLLKSKHNDPSLVKIFDYFENSAYTIFHGTKDFIWTIDLKSNNLGEVISYLRDFGDQLFERNDITFHVENDILDGNVDIQLPDGYNRQIILIFKEAMTNSLKHSRAKNVFFSIKVIRGVYEVNFADDGLWRENAQNGNGIRNMTQRAEKINGILSIKQNQNKTTVSLSFKINKS